MKNGDLESLVRKYPVTNIDWELNNVNVMNMSIRKAVFYYRSGKLLTNSLNHNFMTTLTQRMIDAERIYVGVYDHFVRRLKRNDYNIANILVDAWGRQFPKYDDVWGKNWGSLYKMNMQNNIIYDNGYELKDGNDIIVCKVTVSSIEGRAIYFLDVFE